MTLNVTIDNRDFSSPPLRPASFMVDRLTWSAFGGPDQGVLLATAPVDKLFEFTSLLRCPVMVNDQEAQPVWWGYVSKITILFTKVQFTISLEDLYNRVNVKYAFVSPDNRAADESETGFAEHTRSTAEYGSREIVLHRKNIDDDFALNLRDTFLEISALPRLVLSPLQDDRVAQIKLDCQGWFHTLDWVFYENLEGFYANHGPGPGSLAFGDGSTSYVAQSFLPGAAVDVKYAYLLLRKVGSPTSNLSVQIRDDSGGNPNAVLATSQTVAGSTFPQYNYTWQRFEFASAYSLSAGTRYWLVIDPNTSSGANYYQLRTDENCSYYQDNQYGKRYSGGAWGYIPSITDPGSRPDLMFRVVCVTDTGDQITAIAAAGDQFFTKITEISSGVSASPYRVHGYSCFEEITNLMALGTSNQRLILADVNPQRHLAFYEQPDPAIPTVYMDSGGRYFTRYMKVLKPYHPPVGQFAILSGVDRLAMPFDRLRAPSCFVDHVDYRPPL